MTTTFKALVVNDAAKKSNTPPPQKITTLGSDDLPPAPIHIKVEYSALNYKDALALSGKGKILRTFPIVPGIDAAGTIIQSDVPDFKVGDRVIATGWGIGERYWGSFSEIMAVQPGWLVPMPKELDSHSAMLLGTAGLTAALALLKLERAGITPEQGPVLVTGASGGVGTWAITLLSQAGYEVHALSGKASMHEWLRDLGAAEVIDRDGFADNIRPLGSPRWAAAIDNAGGDILAAILPLIQPEGAVAAIGLAAGMELATTVAPFILRGVSLLGINSVDAPYEQRVEAWKRLAELPRKNFIRINSGTLSLKELGKAADQMMESTLHGRYLVEPGKQD